MECKSRWRECPCNAQERWGVGQRNTEVKAGGDDGNSVSFSGKNSEVTLEVRGEDGGDGREGDLEM